MEGRGPKMSSIRGGGLPGGMGIFAWGDHGTCGKDRQPAMSNSLEEREFLAPVVGPLLTLGSGVGASSLVRAPPVGREIPQVRWWVVEGRLHLLWGWARRILWRWRASSRSL